MSMPAQLLQQAEQMALSCAGSRNVLKSLRGVQGAANATLGTLGGTLLLLQEATALSGAQPDEVRCLGGASVLLGSLHIANAARLLAAQRHAWPPGLQLHGAVAHAICCACVRQGQRMLVCSHQQPTIQWGSASPGLCQGCGHCRHCNPEAGCAGG